MAGVDDAGVPAGLEVAGRVIGDGLAVVIDEGTEVPVGASKGLGAAGAAVVSGGAVSGADSCFGMMNHAPTPKKTSAAIK
jgi:hypothetical protein